MADPRSLRTEIIGSIHTHTHTHSISRSHFAFGHEGLSVRNPLGSLLNFLKMFEPFMANQNGVVPSGFATLIQKPGRANAFFLVGAG